MFCTFQQYDEHDPRTSAELPVAIACARVDAVEVQPSEFETRTDDDGNTTTVEYHRSAIVVGGQRYNVRGTAGSIANSLAQFLGAANGSHQTG